MIELAMIRMFVIIILCVPWCGAIWLNLPTSSSKCVSEELQSNVVVLADYEAVSDDPRHEPPTIGCKVTSPYGKTLHNTENTTKAQFAFTTSESGNYLACFWVDKHHKDVPASVNLEWRIGIAARDWQSVARKDKIEGVELELRKLEEAVESIHHNLIYLRDREAEMREVSERTTSRVAWFSIMSLTICVVTSILQLWYLKRYFQKKKLI